MALGHLKITRQIANLVTDQSAEAVACRTFYTIAKQEMLEEFKWPFAMKQGQLALVEDNPFETSTGYSEWAFAYEYPADAVTFGRIVGPVRNESRNDRIPYRIANNAADSSKLILTDIENAFGEWTTNVVTEDMLAASYILALSFKIAFLVAPMVTGGDPFKLGDRAMKLYDMQLNKAQGSALNEEQVEVEAESEFVLARGYRPFRGGTGIF